MSNRHRTITVTLALTAAAAALTPASSASASTVFTWTGAGTTANWSDAGNWNGDVAPSGSGVTLDFPTGVTNKSSADDLDPTVVGALQFDDTGYSVSGNQLAPTAVSLAANASVTVADPVSSTISGSGAMQVALLSGSSLHLTGVLSGPSPITTSGAGTFDLAGTTANTITGDLDIENTTTLVLDKPSGTLATAGNIVLANGTWQSATARWAASNQVPATEHLLVVGTATADLHGFDDTFTELEMNAGNVTTGAGTLTVSSSIYDNNTTGTISGNLHFTSDPHTIGEAFGDNQLTIDAHFTGNGAIDKTGDGTLILNDACGYTGPLTVDAGTVSAPNGYSGTHSGSFSGGGTCDTSAPSVSVTSAPPPATSQTTATVAFTATDPDDASSSLTFTCALDGAAATACSSPYVSPELVDGTHVLSVVARDPSGNASTAATASWRVDTRAPSASLNTLPIATTAAGVTLHWGGADAGSGLATYDVRYEKAAWTSGFGAWASPTAWQRTRSTTAVLALTRGYDYCVQARSRDAAGNVSAWTASRCVARALDDRAMTIGSGWTKRTGKGYYNGTYVVTAKNHTSLTRAKAQLDRVGVLVTRCAPCGKLAIYVGKVRIGVVNLYSRTTRRQQLILLPRFAYRTGTVTIVTTVARTAQVDGLVVSRT